MYAPHVKAARESNDAASEAVTFARLDESFVDLRPAAAAQRHLAGLIDQSPRVAAQRAQLAIIRGDAVQRRALDDEASNNAVPDRTAEGREEPFVDHRPAPAAQRHLADRINGSPRVAAQRAQIAVIRGDAVQRQAQAPDDGESLEAEPEATGSLPVTANRTGLPDSLKLGIESLSGISMDAVKVHYNSDKPAQLNAHAYAQGAAIHLAPGQERHLPHEAWHLVQQAQGRVRATTQLKGGVPVNDDSGLEAEADRMGHKALESGKKALHNGIAENGERVPLSLRLRSAAVTQRRPWLDNKATGVYRDANLDADLAFVRTIGQGNIGVFIPYGNLDNLRRLIADQTERALNFVHPNQVITFISDGFQRDPGPLFDAVKPVYKENGRALATLPNLAGDPGTILALVRLGRAGAGFFIRKEGGGSRLPKAEGNLYISRMHFDSKNAVLASLEISPQKYAEYAGVNAVLVDSFEDASRLARQDQTRGANIFSGDGFIYASTVTARRSADRKVTANGGDYDDSFSTVADPSEDLSALQSSYESLAGPNATGWVSDLAGGRDGDQNSEMGNWGALGAATFHNRFRSANGGAVPVNQNWEWLHIRGAQIGGETEQGNLLAGTFVANSQMIPFESQIQRWHRGNHGKIFARFSATALDRILASRIKIEIAAVDHPELGTIPREAPLTIEFYPLEGVVIDKLTGKIHQKQFREQARGRAREFQVRLGQLRQPQPERPLLGTQTLPPTDAQPSPSQELVASNSATQVSHLSLGNGLVVTQTPTEVSLEGSLDAIFGGLLNSHDPIGSITPVLRFLGSNGFSIQVPEHGIHIDPSLLLQPQRLFQQLQGLGVAPQPFELDAEDVEGVLGETPAPRGVKRKAAGPLSRLRIKIIGLTSPALLQFGGLPQLPQPLRLFLPPPPQQQDKRKDE